MPLDKKFPAISELISLKAKKAVITGGASGIGLAGAARLAEAGATVMILDSNPEKGSAAALNLQESGYSVYFEACDVTSEEQVKKIMDAAAVKMGGLDILVNNAGIFPAIPFLEFTAADLHKIMAVNLNGLLFCSREAARLMVSHKHGGNIINITSVDALHPIRDNRSIYDASKGAVLSFTRSLAKELAGEDIRVNAIAPGAIFTEGAAADRSAGSSRAGLREIMARIPLRHMGAADDIARVILFLASDLSAYMTGSLVTVDGGFMVS